MALRAEPCAGLDLTTLRSWLEPNQESETQPTKPLRRTLGQALKKKNSATCMQFKKLQDITKILRHHYVRIELNKKIKSSIIIPLSYEILKRTMYTQ